MMGEEDDGEVTYYCMLEYYNKVPGEIWGTPLYINPSLGIDEISSYDDINIFPNPARNILNITSNGCRNNGHSTMVSNRHSAPHPKPPAGYAG